VTGYSGLKISLLNSGDIYSGFTLRTIGLQVTLEDLVSRT
jgi:hypothetical protein